MTRFALAAMAVVALASAGRASDEFSAPPDPDDAAKTVCQLIDESAAAHALPVEFLTRLIWKESRFRANAVSPKGAQGIAQFMPGTAALRGLTDPFDPASAIPAAAHYLSDLSNGFGNLGLAAAAYNGGERRVAEWLAGTGGLPWETRDFVHFITGRPAEDWKSRLSEGVDDDEPAPTTCAEVAAIVSKPGAGAVPVAAAGETAA